MSDDRTADAQPVLECVIFRLRAGVTEAAFRAAIPATGAFLRAAPGFLHRRLGRAEDGEWHDHVEWASMEAARAAARDFMAEPSTRAFNDAIDPATSRMRHYAVQASTDPE